MKTPREILLERHRAATPKLDAIHHKVVTESNHEGTKAQREKMSFMSLCLCGFNKVWHELIFPSRRIWAGLAAIWVFIFIVNFSQHDHSQGTMAKSLLSPEMILTYRQQEKMLAELMSDEPHISESPKTFLPKPSSQRQLEMLTT